MKKHISRRTFTAGALAAGTMAVTSSVGRAAGSNERIRAAVIGCRWRGYEDALALAGTGRFDIATVCDCDRAMYDRAMPKLAKLPAPPAYEKDFRRVLDDKSIDAVAVCTPDHWHVIMAILALQAGKHVYVEKPLSYNIAEGRALVAAAAKYPKLVVCVGTQQRSGAHFIEARQFIAEGGLGKVGFARAWIAHERPVLPVVPDGDPPATMDYDLWLGPAPHRRYNESRVHYNWHWMRDTGTGETGNWGAHWLDTARMLLDLDLPTAVSGVGQTVVKDAKEWPDTITALYEFPALTLVWEQRLWTRFGVQGLGGGVEIGGDKGSLIINRGEWTFHPKGGQPIKHKGFDGNKPHAVNFADCIAGTAKPAASVEEGNRSAILCHLANITATLNRRVAFDPARQEITGDSEAAKLVGRSYRERWKLPTP